MTWGPHGGRGHTSQPVAAAWGSVWAPRKWRCLGCSPSRAGGRELPGTWLSPGKRVGQLPSDRATLKTEYYEPWSLLCTRQCGIFKGLLLTSLKTDFSATFLKMCKPRFTDLGLFMTRNHPQGWSAACRFPVARGSLQTHGKSQMPRALGSRPGNPSDWAPPCGHQVAPTTNTARISPLLVFRQLET